MTTRVFVYHDKELNVPTAPDGISNNFWEKKILKNYKFWTISTTKWEKWKNEY